MVESTRRRERVAGELMKGAAALEERGLAQLARELRRQATAILYGTIGARIEAEIATAASRTKL